MKKAKATAKATADKASLVPDEELEFNGRKPRNDYERAQAIIRMGAARNAPLSAPPSAPPSAPASAFASTCGAARVAGGCGA